MLDVYRSYLRTGLLVSLLCVAAMLAVSFADRPTPLTAPSPARTALPATLPGGGRSLFPAYQLVALYGAADNPALGALGEQPMTAAIGRAKQLAADYQNLKLPDQAQVMPALELIATVASASPTDNGDYSRQTDADSLLPWIVAAQKAGVYVVLDLQPGRSDFTSQAAQYTSLLRFPNVGLALDPEWRLKPDQLPLAQIGSVDIAEVNRTAAWLADLTHRHKLPQKLLLLHQFRLDMIADRAALDTSRPELAYVIQMDGSGSQLQKQATWQAVTKDIPASTRTGWKNFYKLDAPMLTPAETMSIRPLPAYISYQ